MNLQQKFSPLTFGLSDWMERVYIHGEVQLVLDCLYPGHLELAGFVDALSVPVCPVDIVLKQGQSKGVWQT